MRETIAVSEISLRNDSPHQDEIRLADHQSDQQLVAKMAQSDEAALEELIRRYSGQVARVCRRICHDESETNCLVSEVFWELWSRAGSFDATRGGVRTYLMMIARCKSIDYRRSAASRQRVQAKLVQFSECSLPDSAASEHPSSETIRMEWSAQLQAALHNLPLSQRRPIELAFFDGYTHSEVARQLNAPLGTIKSRIRTGLLQLKRSLPEEFSSEETK